MASPQIENGHTRTANELIEALMITKLNGTQFRIVLTVIRYTYGFQRKDKDLSLSYISNATQLNKMQIQRELKTLIELRVINVIEEANFNSTRIIAINKNYEEWTVYIKQQNEQLANPLTVSESASEQLANPLTPPVSESANQERKVLKKDLNKVIYMPCVEISTINEKCFEITGDFMTSEFKLDCEMRLQEGTEVDLIYKSLAIASTKTEQGRCKYAIGILKNWASSGIKTIDKYKAKFEKQAAQRANQNEPQKQISGPKNLITHDVLAAELGLTLEEYERRFL
jgi:phage replication O-like protein O